MEPYIPYLFLLGRVLYGGFFVRAGLNHFKNNTAIANQAALKGIPMPKATVYLSGLMMLLAGLYIIFGFLVSWGILFIVLSLGIMSFKMHAFWKDIEPETKALNEASFWKNMALIGGALMLSTTVSTIAQHWQFALNWWI